MDIIKTRFEEHIALAQLIAQSEIMQQVADAAAIIKKALAGGHKVLFCGNGGSAADSRQRSRQPAPGSRICRTLSKRTQRHCRYCTYRRYFHLNGGCQ